MKAPCRSLKCFKLLIFIRKIQDATETIEVASKGSCVFRWSFVVNARNFLCLTDFQESIFVGENAKNRDFCGFLPFISARVHQSWINHGAVLPSLTPRLARWYTIYRVCKAPLRAALRAGRQEARRAATMLSW
jgi:hypothetical protein